MPDLLEQLFEKDKERWVKFRYTDTAKCRGAFRMFFSDSEQNKAFIQEKGYEVIAIGCMDEHKPQVAALVDLSIEIKNLLYNYQVDENTLSAISALFKAKIEEVNKQAIREK